LKRTSLLNILIALVGTFGIISCNESKDVGPETVGYDYYPLEVGQFRIYDVEEIRYLITGFDTSVYQLREIILDTIQSANQTTYLLRRDVRENAQDNWESDSIWTVARAFNYLSITENNIPLVKLTFPVNIGNQWDGNGLSSRAEQLYRYQQVESSMIDSIQTDDHVRVIIENVEENITGVDLRSEVYVRGIGLVEKDFLTQKKCTASDCGPDLGEVIAGRSVKQTLIEIGNEE